MKAVSESTWTFQMIIFFMLIFACFLTLVLSYNKAYTIKNRMLSIVEKYEGITSESLKIINGYVLEKGYKMYNGHVVCDVKVDVVRGITFAQGYEEF